jgi:hypothetical protein
MYLSEVHSLTTSAGIWAIVIVAVICLTFWLVMVVAVAPRGYSRDRYRRQPPPVPHLGGRDLPVVGGMHVSAGGRSVAPSRDEAATAMPVRAEAPGTNGTGAGETGAEVTRDDLPSVPAQRSAQPSQRPARQPAGPSPLDLGGPVPPRQREPEADQPVRRGRA